jgi:tetratricopeptide (TPR) repeat protein
MVHAACGFVLNLTFSRMFRKLFLIPILLIAAIAVSAQPNASPTPTPAAGAPFQLSDYGVQVQPDPRLIIVMAALDAAGFDPTPAGKEPSAFRRMVRTDQEALDPALRQRMKKFFDLNKLPDPAKPADQAARYVSLAYAIGQPPLLEAPERSDDLPSGVLEVLDFAPLVRDFYRKSGLDERMVSYMHAYQAEGDRLRPGSADMVRAVLSYLHTRPIAVSTERVRVKSPDKKKADAVVYSTRDHERHFYIVPDLLAVPGAVNFRVIADDYYAIVAEGADPTSPEIRHAFLQFVIDPLIRKFNREISAQREQIKQLIDLRTKAGATISPDVFIVVGRSLVTAAEARFDETVRLTELTNWQRRRLQQAKDDAERKSVAKQAESARAAIADEVIARLAEEYENGAALDFFFADQLRDFQSSGFDIANFFADMLAGIDATKESKRLADATAARTRALEARKAHAHYSVWLVDPTFEAGEAVEMTRNAALLNKLAEVEKLLQTRNYEQAETTLKGMLLDYPGDVRLLFTLGKTATLWARDTTDDDLQIQRANRALASYRLAVAAASPETDKGLLSRAHESMGRIFAFLDQKDEAMKEFEAAIKIGPVAGGAYDDALAGKRKLAQP